jgi:dihydrofolate reductase
MDANRKLIVSEWMSLDGVFDAQSMGTWFNPFESAERGATIKEGIDAAGALLFGRVTYQMLSGYWPNLKNNEMGVADQMNSLPKYVVSSTLARADWNNSTVVAGDAAAAIADLKRQPGGEILCFGSAALVRSLLPSGLIDELRLLVHPVVMGTGKRVFTDGMAVATLELVESRQLPSGVLALRYRPAR